MNIKCKEINRNSTFSEVIYVICTLWGTNNKIGYVWRVYQRKRKSKRKLLWKRIIRKAKDGVKYTSYCREKRG